MSKIIVALDGMSLEQAKEWAQKLSGKVWGFKINDLLYDCYWPQLLRFGKIMADPKFHDIPNTIDNSLKLFSGVELITVHASAGQTALKTAVNVVGKRLLAVTALTSLTDEEAIEVYGCTRQEVAIRLAKIAVESGVKGLVCSSNDLPYLKKYDVLKVCPGIRLGNECHDQKAVGNGIGADLVVVGRPITQSQDPITVVDELNKVL